MSQSPSEEPSDTSNLDRSLTPMQEPLMEILESMREDIGCRLLGSDGVIRQFDFLGNVVDARRLKPFQIEEFYYIFNFIPEEKHIDTIIDAWKATDQQMFNPLEEDQVEPMNTETLSEVVTCMAKTTPIDVIQELIDDAMDRQRQKEAVQREESGVST